MHVQGMFVTEKSGCLRVPSSDLNINIYKNGKNNKSILRIPYLHIRKKKKSLFFCANVLCYWSDYVQCHNLLLTELR